MANDMTILGGIIFILIFSSVIATYINSEFNAGLPENNIDNLESDISTKAHENELNAWTVFGDIIAMFFWSFGNLPIWLDLVIYLPLRIIMYFIIIRNVWVGGGA